MSEEKNKQLQKFQTRANLPKYFRVAAVLGLITTVIVIVVAFLFTDRTEFRMKSLPANLSENVVAQINQFERRETDEQGNPKYYIKAEKATTFSDNHQEMENVFLQVYDETGQNSDVITAEKGIYVPKENKNFDAFFAGNVNVETRDNLKVKTEQLSYKKEFGIAEAEEYIVFEKENVSGNSVGAIVHINEKRIELLKDVEINSFDINQKGNSAKSEIKSAKLTANYASFDQGAGKIDLNENVVIDVIPSGENKQLSQPTEIKANHATAFFTGKEIKQIDLTGNVRVSQKPTSNNSKYTNTIASRAKVKIEKELKTLELFENVEIETTANSEKPTKINAQYALYQKDADRFELKNGVQIITAQNNRAANIKASEAIYEQSNGKIFLNGNAEITQGNDFIKGDQLNADLFPSKQIKYAVAKGNAYLRQATNDRTTEISAPELDALFGENQKINKANALGASNVNIIPSNAVEFSKLTLSAPKAIRLIFQNDGLLQQMQTEGRTTINLNAPNNNPDAANKRLTADSVKTILQGDGKNLQRAEADGNAELYVEPLRASAQNYKTTINAPRFVCDFFQTGNNAKNCTAGTKTKTVRVPTVAANNRGNQTLSADSLNAVFGQNSQDIESLTADGNAKFSELDRNAIASQIIYTANDGAVKLRGGEPTVWDSRARAKADQIDWDTRHSKSILSGGVSTTYYNQKATGGATPFTSTNSPVYLTAENAELNHTAESAVYTGNARVWQENNYVRADKLFLEQKQGKLYGEGNVQSSVYDVKRKENGKVENVPVSASANKISYSQDNRILRYEGAVDIRQGTDRITSEIATISMDANNEIEKTIVENNVVLTQPKRKAVGNWAQYTASSEEFILRGNPARIDDAEQGSSAGAQVTVFMKENRVVGESKTAQTNTGRIRSVYKIKKNE
ncbi:MAG: LPS export ABC transporter periplasmic protein LptC [Pyrinomonadaceae bacterium]